VLGERDRDVDDEGGGERWADGVRAENGDRCESD
jgi:hypothetical protein